MISDKDIIVELLRQREDLRATLDAIKSGNFSSLPNSIQAALKPDNSEWRNIPDNQESVEFVNELNEIIAGLRKELKECHAGLKTTTEQSYCAEWKRMVDDLRQEVHDLRKENYDLSNLNVKNSDQLKCCRAELDDLKSSYEVKQVEKLMDERDRLMVECDELRKERAANQAEYERLDEWKFDHIRAMSDLFGYSKDRPILFNIEAETKALIVERESLKNELEQERIKRQQYEDIATDRKTAYLELRSEYDKLTARAWPTTK